MGSLRQFSLNIGGYQTRLVRGVGQVVRNVATAVEKTLVESTPVDTGLARSNWIASINSPNLDVVPPYSPGRYLGLAETDNAAGAIAAAGVVIAAATGVGQAIWIQNNVFYIGVLNDGHSAQAPALFVEQAVQAGVNQVKDASILVGATQVI